MSSTTKPPPFDSSNGWDQELFDDFEVTCAKAASLAKTARTLGRLSGEKDRADAEKAVRSARKHMERALRQVRMLLRERR